MSKKEIKIRKKWPVPDFDPTTKVHKVDTSYQRKSNKKLIEDALLEAEEDDQDLDFNF